MNARRRSATAWVQRLSRQLVDLAADVAGRMDERRHAARSVIHEVAPVVMDAAIEPRDEPIEHARHLAAWTDARVGDLVRVLADVRHQRPLGEHGEASRWLGAAFERHRSIAAAPPKLLDRLRTAQAVVDELDHWQAVTQVLPELCEPSEPAMAAVLEWAERRTRAAREDARRRAKRVEIDAIERGVGRHTDRLVAAFVRGRADPGAMLQSWLREHDRTLQRTPSAPLAAWEELGITLEVFAASLPADAPRVRALLDEMHRARRRENALRHTIAALERRRAKLAARGRMSLAASIEPVLTRARGRTRVPPSFPTRPALERLREWTMEP